MADIDKTNALKLKLKSVTKLKLLREIELCKTREMERSLYDELAMVKSENEFLGEQLETIKTSIAQAMHQLCMIEICSTSEKTKIEAHIRNMEQHRKGFQDIFDKERNQYELRTKELHEKEAADEELMRQKEKELAERNEQQTKEAAAFEAESAALEQECVILKKRNKAIMLKLRRRLLETEQVRRELIKRNVLPDQNPK